MQKKRNRRYRRLRSEENVAEVGRTGPTTPLYTSLGTRAGAVGVGVSVRWLILEGLAARAGAPLRDTAEQR